MEEETSRTSPTSNSEETLYGNGGYDSLNGIALRGSEFRKHRPGDGVEPQGGATYLGTQCETVKSRAQEMFLNPIRNPAESHRPRISEAESGGSGVAAGSGRGGS
jgi:hypothetical protein